MPRFARLLVFLLGLVVLVGGCRSSRRAPQWLPAGWTEKSRARYDRSNLYDYVDGGADRYLKRGFRGLATARYANRAGDALTVDAYDMGAVMNATETMNDAKLPSPRPLALGDASVGHEFGVHCRRGGLYVEVTIPRATPALTAAAEAFARVTCAARDANAR
jgi:hypothetical protein